MKKTVIVAAILAIAGTHIQTARAGDREWATAGKVLTGVAIGAVIASAVEARANYSVTHSSAPAYCPPAPVVVAPPPVVFVPPRMVVAPPPVLCAPRPVVVYRSPVVCAPPVKYVTYRHYDTHRHGHHGRHGRH